jgi:hypothetical protein
VVPASTLGWSRPTDSFLLDKDECYGPFPDECSARVASQGKPSKFGYGNFAPELHFLFPKGGSPKLVRDWRPKR